MPNIGTNLSLLPILAKKGATVLTKTAKPVSLVVSPFLVPSVAPDKSLAAFKKPRPIDIAVPIPGTNVAIPEAKSIKPPTTSPAITLLIAEPKLIIKPITGSFLAIGPKNFAKAGNNLLATSTILGKNISTPSLPTSFITPFQGPSLNQLPIANANDPASPVTSGTNALPNTLLNTPPRFPVPPPPLLLAGAVVAAAADFAGIPRPCKALAIFSKAGSLISDITTSLGFSCCKACLDSSPVSSSAACWVVINVLSFSIRVFKELLLVLNSFKRSGDIAIVFCSVALPAKARKRLAAGSTPGSFAFPVPSTISNT